MRGFFEGVKSRDSYDEAKGVVTNVFSLSCLCSTDQVFDHRHVQSAEEIFQGCLQHLQYATNGGLIR